ncbi:MAG: toxin co-regulated pilus biosynthesis Q family protein [Alphaproteobacteria bacterium]|nr:toxin co-regulated pilus biosynthesis Q family protein [Alphaproteobacteria bacterium]MBN2779544.1 toxin co-regulated pilus biosynthesis Q family protein [Alphaproteobacteria bacterium]
MRIHLFYALLFVSTAALADGMAEPKQALPPVAWPVANSVSSYQMPLGRVQEPRDPIADGGWTGGASYTPPGGIPVALEGKEAPAGTKMRLIHKDLMIDDGGQTVAASVPPVDPNAYGYGLAALLSKGISKERLSLKSETTEHVPNVSRKWIAKEGQTLKEVLKDWALHEGWEVVWNTHRSYPLRAGAVFNGRFTDVSSALIRTFGRAAPPPYAKFYYGNKVLVLRTLEDENAD